MIVRVGPAALLGAASAANASPWSRLHHEFLAISRIDYFRSDLGEISLHGELVDGYFERVQTNNYLEFGLTDETTIGGKIFYGTNWLTRGAEVETDSGFTEIELFAQHQLYRTPRHAFAARLAVGVPTGFDSSIRPDLHSDSADVEVSALYGQTVVFRPVRVFAAAEAGYRRRFGDSADQLRVLTTFGFEPSVRWLFMLETYSVKSLGNEKAGGVDFDIYKIRPSVSWRASSRWAIQAGIEEEYAGRNIVRGRTFFLGLWTRF